MTDAQKFKFYLPAWKRCAAANNWVMHGRPSRLQVDVEGQFDEVRSGASPESRIRTTESRRGGTTRCVQSPKSENAHLSLPSPPAERVSEYRPAWPEPAQAEMLKVLTFAKQLSLQEYRAVTAEDLRHACTWVALEGKTTSSKHLNNKEVNRVVTLFRLLEDPDDLDAVMDWLHPENAERRSMVAFLRKCAPEATLVAIFRNCYGTIFWEDGDYQQLRWLAKQVKDRRHGWNGQLRGGELRVERKRDPELEPF